MSFIEGFLTGFGREGTRILREQDKQKRQVELLAEQSRMQLENSLKINEEKATQKLQQQRELAEYRAQLERRQLIEGLAFLGYGAAPTQATSMGEPSTAAVGDTVLDYPLTQATPSGDETLAPIPQQPSTVPQQAPIIAPLQDTFSPDERAFMGQQMTLGVPPKDMVANVLKIRPKPPTPEEQLKVQTAENLASLQEDGMPWTEVEKLANKTTLGDAAARIRLTKQLEKDATNIAEVESALQSPESAETLKLAKQAAAEVGDSWLNKYIPNVSDDARFLEALNVRDSFLALVQSMVGAVSNAETTALLEAGIGPDSPKEQRLTFISMLQAAMARKEQQLDFYQAYQNAPGNRVGTLKGAEEAWRKFTKENQLVETQYYDKETGARLSPEQAKGRDRESVLSLLNINDSYDNIVKDKSYLTYIPGNTSVPKPIPTPTYGTKRPESEKTGIGLAIDRLKKSMPNALNILE